MTTINQSIRKKKIKKNKITILNNNPQIQGLFLHSILVSPKKPNSANRKVAIIKLKNDKKIKAYIPGTNTVRSLKTNSKILIRGGGTRDLPGINYTVVLGGLNTSTKGTRINKRSKYGVKSPRKEDIK